MAFRFSLATVLRYRDSVEKREELALRKSLLDLARARQEVERLTAEIATARDSQNKALQHTLSAFDLQRMLDAIDAAIARRKVVVESLPALERKREACMKSYQTAHRDCQTLSEMRERQRDEFDQERARAEQKFLDDVFGARAQRN